MRVAESRADPLCPNCKATLDGVDRHLVDSSFLTGRRVYAYSCPRCHTVIPVSHSFYV